MCNINKSRTKLRHCATGLFIFLALDVVWIVYPGKLELHTVFRTRRKSERLLSLEHESKLATCLVGTMSQLSQPQAQMNIRRYIVDALNSTLFLHFDTNEDANGNFKEIFPAATLSASEISAMLERTGVHKYEIKSYVQDTRSLYVASNCSGIDRKQAWSRRDWFIRSGILLSPLWHHIQGCAKLIKQHESERNQPFKWILLSVTQNRFLPMMLKTLNEDQVYIDVKFGENGTYEIPGRVVLMSRKHLESYANFLEEVRALDCSNLNISYCKRAFIPECLVTWFLTEYYPVDFSPLESVGFRWKLLRRCGSPQDCLEDAKHLITICSDPITAKVLTECQFVKDLRGYHGLVH